MKNTITETVENWLYRKRGFNGFAIQFFTSLKYLLSVCIAIAYTPLFSQTKHIEFKWPHVVVGTFTSNQDYSSLFIGLNSTYQAGPDSLSVLKCNILKLYSSSATIFDNSQVIFIDNTRFFCYYPGCMSRFYSAGYYKTKNDKIVLTPNADVEKRIKNFITLDTKNIKYATFTDTVFLIEDNMLILKKQD